ncbi:hypothetical protein N7492_004103 [Penicillium capsulatum]|uniref:Uncharacterized protein n=1 Tax=Penicillium capsulatum TaxID=69766 RepID=A0A9W9LWV9_9EURO|nr:hypothetical protein N7492_004103 [Penicillium capsulatum]KAJ6121324.1 hypothetical protein N7512_003789 [Penicillium capsulatum]
MALVRDPYFWKRFSKAVHEEEVAKNGNQGLNTPQSEKESNSWLARERQKSRRSLIYGFVIAFCVILVVIGVVIVWWLSKHHWLQPVEP